MKKSIWIPLVIILAGLCLAGATWAANGNSVFRPGIYLDRDGLHTDTGKLITVDESYQPSEVKNIAVDVSYMNHVSVKEGEANGKITVKGANYESNGGLVSALANGSLSVTAKDPNHRFRWGINFNIEALVNNGNCYLEITVPAGTKLDVLKADIDASKLDFSGINAGTISTDNNYGDIVLKDIQTGNLTAEADAGKIRAENITADGLVDIRNNFGGIVLGDVQSGSMTLDLSSGELSAASVKTGNLTVSNSFGEISIDRLTLAGLCEIDADSGNVYIGLTNAEAEVGYDLDVDAGNISVNGSSLKDGDVSKGVAGDVSKDAANEKAHVRASNNFGNITLEFGK